VLRAIFTTVLTTVLTTGLRAIFTAGLCASLACEPQVTSHAAPELGKAPDPAAATGFGLSSSSENTAAAELSAEELSSADLYQDALYDRPRLDIYEVAADIRYVELVTGGAMPEAELPMVIAVHGRGDRPERFAQLLRGFGRPARVVFPAGIVAERGGFAWFKIRARDRDVEGFAAGVSTAADRLVEFIDAVTVDRPTTGRPVLTGFSQGGIVSFAVAMRYPEKIAAAYPIGGWLPPPLWPAAGPPDIAAPPILALHGDADAVIPVAPTRRAVSKLQALGFPVLLREYPAARHQITGEMRRLLWNQLEAATMALRAGNPIRLPPPVKRRRRTVAQVRPDPSPVGFDGRRRRMRRGGLSGP